MRFPLTSQLLWRLPRHPDWRYELDAGEVILSHRPRSLRLCRPTALPVVPSRAVGEVRELDLVCDRRAVARLLLEAWSVEDPYRTLGDELLGSQIEQGLGTAETGAVAVDLETGAVCAAALVHGDRRGPPMLGWLTVAREARERGLATELLRLIVTVLRARGVGELASGASAANVPSLRWHFSRGFRLAEDPLRAAVAESRASIGDRLG